MSDDDRGVEFISNPNRIRSRVKVVAGKDANEMIGRADRSVGQLAGGFSEILGESLEQVLRARRDVEGAGDREIGIAKIRKVLHELRGQAGTFGYTLISQIADSCCRFIDRAPTLGPREAEIIAMHVDALLAVRASNIKDATEPAGAELVTGLRQVTAQHAPGKR